MHLGKTEVGNTSLGSSRCQSTRVDPRFVESGMKAALEHTHTSLWGLKEWTRKALRVFFCALRGMNHKEAWTAF